MKLATVHQVIDAALAMTALINKAFSPGVWSRRGKGHLEFLSSCPDTGHPVLFELLFSPPMECPGEVTAIISYGDGRQGWSVGPVGTAGDVMACLMGYKAVLDKEDRGGCIKDTCHPLLVQARREPHLHDEQVEREASR